MLGFSNEEVDSKVLMMYSEKECLVTWYGWTTSAFHSKHCTHPGFRGEPGRPRTNWRGTAGKKTWREWNMPTQRVGDFVRPSLCLSMSLCLFVYVRARETGRYDCITCNHLRYSDSIVATRSPADEASIAFQLDYCNAVTPCRTAASRCEDSPGRWHTLQPYINCHMPLSTGIRLLAAEGVLFSGCARQMHAWSYILKVC